MRAFVITSVDPKRRHGRRARRAAFYCRARRIRYVRRVMENPEFLREFNAEAERRLMNLVIYGTSHPEALLSSRKMEEPNDA